MSDTEDEETFDVSSPQSTDTNEYVFQWEEGFTDLNIRVEDRLIAVNKGFLMTVSPVFKRMFLSDFKEKNAEVVDLPEKKYSEMVEFLRFLMQEKNPEMTDQRTDFLIPLASEYQTFHLMTRCEGYLLNRYFDQYDVEPTRHHLLKFIMFGLNYGCKRLESKARERLAKFCFKDIESDEIFDNFTMECKLALYRDRMGVVETKYTVHRRNLSAMNDVMLQK